MACSLARKRWSVASAGGRSTDACRRGVWNALYPGVYRLAGAPSTWRQSLLAACLAWGDGAVVSHRAAAALWSLPGFASHVIELSVPRGRQRVRPGKVHRPMSLGSADVT